MHQSVVRLLSAMTTNKCADVFVSPKTILPGLVLTMGIPPWVVSWLVPIREAFALLPQGLLSVYLRNENKRYKVWRLGMVTQIICLLLILTLALWSNGRSAESDNHLAIGLIFLVCLALYSCGRSVCSLTFKDVQGDLVDKGKRGRLVGMASTFSGLITLGIAIPLLWFDSYQSSLSVVGLIVLAIIMCILTVVIMLPIKTKVDVSKIDYSSGSIIGRVIPNLDSTAWRFIIVRSIFVHSALVAPFFMIANQHSATELMAYFLAAEALAALLFARLWGKLADQSARLTLRVAGVLAIGACIGLMLLQQQTLWLSTGLFFVLSIAHTGVRTGRKTYSLDVKDGQDRTELVGSANSFIGVVLIVLGSLYAALQSFMQQQVVWIMAFMLVLGVAATFILSSEKMSISSDD